MIAALFSTLAMLGGSLADAPSPARYTLGVSVLQNGVETVAAHSLIQEDGTAEISISDGVETFALNAELFVQKDDGAATELGLTATITHGDRPTLTPRFVFLRGAKAAMEVGDPAYEVQLHLDPVAP